MGEIQNQPFQLSFNASLKVDFQGSRVTSDGGLILVRELDERLGFGELIEQHLTDSRRGKNTQFPFADLLRQSVYSRLAGYEDLNDAERLSQDPTFRLIGSEKVWDRGAALTSRLQTFETEMLAEEENFAGLGRLNRALIGKAETMDSGYRTVLDMDSTEIPVYGEQEQSAYNGHFESTCYHPLLLFNREGDCLAAKLAARQRAQCRRLGRTPAARDRAAAEDGQRGGVPGRCRLCQAGDLRGAGGAWREVCHPHPGQRQPGAGHRGVADRARWAGRARSRWSSTRAFSTRRRVGRRRGGWWRRWSITAGELFPRVGFIVTNLTLPAGRWCGSTTSGERRSSGSRKASRR